jgi:hypothetical protein
MKTVQVTLSHHDPGNCRVYYRTIPNNQLICTQEEGSTGEVWYTCIDDGCWDEPESPIDMSKYNIEIVEPHDPKQEHDLNWLVTLHKQAKAMGMSDEKIKEVARTEGGLNPKAMETYLAMENFE